MTATSKSEVNITLYRGLQGIGTYVWSPFVTKVEARLRFAGISYRAETGSLSKSPRGKIPYLEISNSDSASPDADSPRMLADSTLISNKLAEDGVLDDLNAKLSPAEKAHDLAIRALLEDKLYFYSSYEKWNENYYSMRPHVLSSLPYPVQVVVGLLVYRKMNQTLYGQGTGRFSAEEIRSFRYQIWENVNALLLESKRKMPKKKSGNETFWVLGGNEPSEADTVVFGFINSALVCTAAPDTQKAVKSFPVLVEYAQRIHDRYFPDYTCWE